MKNALLVLDCSYLKDWFAPNADSYTTVSFVSPVEMKRRTELEVCKFYKRLNWSSWPGMICSVAVIVEEAFLSNARSHSSLRFLDECAGRFKSLHIAVNGQWMPRSLMRSVARCLEMETWNIDILFIAFVTRSRKVCRLNIKCIVSIIVCSSSFLLQYTRDRIYLESYPNI